jgi:hypothetical protein
VKERIRLLAEQAFTAVGTKHDSITHQDQSVLDKNDTITVYTFTQNTMDKFAELIVRECIERVCNQYTPIRDCTIQGRPNPFFPELRVRTECEQAVIESGIKSIIALEELIQESTDRWYKENVLGDEA